jgi:SAM-dependent methyltransferase
MRGPKVENGVVVGNTYDKYGSSNPLVRHIVSGFLATFDELVERSGASSVFEVGCGEGELALRCVRKGLHTRATDISPAMVDEARSRAERKGVALEVWVADLFSIGKLEPPPDLVVCCEVLEHVPDPEKALEQLEALNARHYLLSVPREPLWRVLNMGRGRYLRDFGNTPGHLQHWSRRQFIETVTSVFEIREVRSPIPWTMVLARRKTPSDQ